ncbi:MAG TPA: single-stranded-DNA-specific exonuclease RecJ [Miltoncostaeaceae bacterium]|nr:single-stranded-DNA-specific exonuclease RecJ [Miltoncostaeaceae bacterium]
MSWRAERVRLADVARIEEALGCPEPLAWALVRRGLADPAEARAFLDSDGPLDPPEAIPGIAEAADRVVRAVERGEPIVVHGDYDCDGITATAILVRALEGRGARARPFLPSRFTDGYGVAESTVERLAEEGCRLLVCVDCGTTAVGPLTRARELGMDAIVCDHHLAGGVRPPAILANPALGRGTEVLPAAAGVAFKLVQAVAARMDGDRLAPAPEEALDLVALATVADAVPLLGENRRLVARGLAALRREPRPGIAALCRAAGISPRAADARTLGWQIAPAINAAGRMSHPERALELLLAEPGPAADALAEELWALNLERREVEQRVTAEAIALIEAFPEEDRQADALVAAGSGWHEGVVGIVASRLVERFGRPAIVITDLGDRAKGSGRSLPGVDLHGLVGGAAGTLRRWGGHAGAVGLELAPADIGRFRRELALAAVGARASIARARVRRVDAIAGVHDLDLRTAEALEAMAPFGAGNPEVRLLIPAAAVAGAGTAGTDGRHLTLRLRGGGAHARAVGFGMGERVEAIDAERRHDAIVQLGVDRWQELVGPKVVLEALEPVEPARRPLPGMCAQACDIACPSRAGSGELRALVAASERPPAAPEPDPPPALRDRRGRGAAVAAVAALAGADGGVVAVVGDVARRRAALEEALEPARLGAERAVIGGSRCELGALAARMAGAPGAPVVAMVEYERLPDLELPPDAHVVLLDPPWDAGALAWAVARASGRTLHPVYGDDEIALAERLAEERWDLRPAAAAVWTALRDGRPRAWGPALEAELLGDGPAIRPPAAVARALAALAEVGLVRVDDQGLQALPEAGRRDLDAAPAARAAAERLREVRGFLAHALTLDLRVPAVPLEDGQPAAR